MKERTYFGSVYVANSMVGEYLLPVIESFVKYSLSCDDNGILVSGTNMSFLKDDLLWNGFLNSGRIIFFESGHTVWLRKPLINHVGFLGISCVTKEMASSLVAFNDELREFDDKFASNLRKTLIRIEQELDG